MSFGDLTRIGTNVQALQANNYLQRTNQNIGQRQLRLATGSQINRAEDDSAGYSISKKLEAKVRGQAQALGNIGDAKSMLTVGEGALNSVMDILQTMKEKTIQAANDTMGVNERNAIQSQLNQLSTEIGEVLNTAEFNGVKLFEGDEGADLKLNFQVGAENADTFDVNIAEMSAGTLFGEDFGGTVTGGWDGGNITFDSYAGEEAATYQFRITEEAGTLQISHSTDGDTWSTAAPLATGDLVAGDLTINIGDIATAAENDTFTVVVAGPLAVSSHASASASIKTVDEAIDTVSKQLANLGDSQMRLTFKQDNLQTSMTNYEAARSRINDADFAKEQMELIKLQILQQTGTAALAQANAAPQAVLSLF